MTLRAHIDRLSLVPLLAAWLLGTWASLAQPQRLGDLDADSQPTVLDLVRLIGHVNGTAPLPNALRVYGDLNEDGVIDPTDVDWVADAIIGARELPNPYAAPLATAAVTATNGTSVVVSGLARPHRSIVVEGGAARVTAQADAVGRFVVPVPLQSNRLNILHVSAANDTFAAGTPQTLRIIQDAQAPSLFIDFPASGTDLISSSVVVAGRVGDLLSGFLGLSVMVTNLAALPAPVAGDAGGPANVIVGIGNNGTFERSAVPLIVGTNVLVVTARDLHGNTITKTNTVRRFVPTGLRMIAVSGDMQETNVHRRLAQPIVARIEDATGAPWSNKVVTFTVTRSNGRLFPIAASDLAASPAPSGEDGAPGTMTLALRTDGQGFARAWWTLGSDAGCGNNRVCVTSRDIEGAAYFCASARPAPATQINVGSGHLQRAEAGGPASEPLRAWVSDACNGIAGVPVTFRVVEGSGKLLATDRGANSGDTGTSELTVHTSSTGHAEAGFILGSQTGPNVIEATFPNGAGRPATFVLEGVTRHPSAATTFSGVVLDNANQPIGGARCVLSVGGQDFTTISGANGEFRFAAPRLTPAALDLPSGPGHLFVNGFVATTLKSEPIPVGSFPALSYALTLIPHAPNSLPTPVLLPRLNPANARAYDGTTDLVLTCEGMAGLKMTIAAGSMRQPDGSRVTPANPAVVALNPVHADKIPMPLPDGAAGPFAWTLQPGGAHFDPPIRITYPNMSGLPAGAVGYFLSFNHDTERFEIVSSGHVGTDGAEIVTDPGSGLSVAGWGGFCPPYPATGDVEKCDPKGPAPSPEDFRFDDSLPFGQGEPPAGLNYCGLTRIEWDETDFWCDCGPDGKRTVARTKVIAILTQFWARTAITDELDIEFIRTHEERHVALRREFFEQKVKEAKVINGVNFGTEATCGQIINDFIKRFNEDYEFNSFRNCSEIDTLDQKQFCSDMIREYGLEPTPGEPEHKELSICDLLSADPGGDFEELREAPWTVTVGGQTTTVRTLNGFRMRNVSAPDDFGPGGPGTARDGLSDDRLRLTGQRTKNGVTEFVVSPFFQIRQNGTVILGELTRSTTPPRRPESIRAQPERTTLNATGQSTTVRVTALFSDGTSEDRTGSAKGTTYRVSNPSIATVDELGGLTARAAGIVFVTAVSEGATSVAQVNVSPGDPLTLVEGFVRRPDGTPAAGVGVHIGGLATGRTGADGRFSVPNVPTALGAIRVTAQTAAGTQRWVARSGSIPAIPSGVTDAGILELSPFLATPVTDFGAGDAHTVALRRDRSLWTWGGNFAGQLGDGTATSRPRPVHVNPGTEWNVVAAGDAFTLGIRVDGTLWAWGQNTQGQLGDGTTARKLRPVQVGAANDWRTVAAGGMHSVAIKTDGTLWAWGHNFNGQLGDATSINRNAPVRVGLDSDWSAVDAGDLFTIALKTDGSLWAWGQNGVGQLGHGSRTATNSPTRVGLETDWASISAGGTHVLAVKTDGTLWAWGANLASQIGDGSNAMRLEPIRIGQDNDWAVVAAGLQHSAATKLDETLWVWGDNAEGQLGDDTFVDQAEPIPVKLGSGWTAVAAGQSHTVGLTADATLWAWGQFLAGQLGDDRSSPAQVGPASNWITVSAGDEHGLALRSDGSLWTWGVGFFGQLGNGLNANVSSPIPSTMTNDWSDVAAGDLHSLARRADGSLWAWGNNGSGRLGDGTMANRNLPVRIGTASDWTTFAAASDHSLALKSDGSLWAWGENGRGQLGDGTMADRSSPARIGSDNDWRAISAGTSYSMAVRGDGSLWAWGDNSDGQHGDNSTGAKSSPARVGRDTDWRAVSAGAEHTLALKTDGSLWAWGLNIIGQVGDGTFTRRLTPVRIGLEQSWTAIAAGDRHSVAVRSDGSLWAWGRNAEGQLGDGTRISRNAPVRIGSATDWAAISVGPLYSLARKSDGTLWSWGDNDNGRLGDGRTVGRIGATADWGLR